MVKLIAEIGINHNGKVENVFKMIDAFSESVDVIKMQKINPKLVLSEKKYNNPHPVLKNSFGKTYGAHKEFLELTIDDYIKVRDYTESKGMIFSSSVWDTETAKDIIALCPDYLKLPSAHCNNMKLINYCLDNFKGKIHISTGMTNKTERQKIENLSNNIILYSCMSNYENDDSPIYIERHYPGFSCHVPNIFYAKAAILNGCKFVEYHVTLDQKQKGTDHKISLLPEQFKELREWYNKNFNEIENIHFKKPVDLISCEETARSKLWVT